jgi:hypothetical protein
LSSKYCIAVYCSNIEYIGEPNRREGPEKASRTVTQEEDLISTVRRQYCGSRERKREKEEDKQKDEEKRTTGLSCNL